MYCHNKFPIKYNTITYMNMQKIPTISKQCYPQNNINRAEYIKNPNLKQTTPPDYYLQQQLKRWNGNVNTKEIINVKYRCKSWYRIKYTINQTSNYQNSIYNCMVHKYMFDGWSLSEYL